MACWEEGGSPRRAWAVPAISSQGLCSLAGSMVVQLGRPGTKAQHRGWVSGVRDRAVHDKSAGQRFLQPLGSRCLWL